MALLDKFKQTLDKLIESPDVSLDLMREIEEILDDIQLRYGTEVYEGLNRCYEVVLSRPEVIPHYEQEYYPASESD